MEDTFSPPCDATAQQRTLTIFPSNATDAPSVAGGCPCRVAGRTGPLANDNAPAGFRFRSASICGWSRTLRDIQAATRARAQAGSRSRSCLAPGETAEHTAQERVG